MSLPTSPSSSTSTLHVSSRLSLPCLLPQPVPCFLSFVFLVGMLCVKNMAHYRVGSKICKKKEKSIQLKSSSLGHFLLLRTLLPEPGDSSPSFSKGTCGKFGELALPAASPSPFRPDHRRSPLFPFFSHTSRQCHQQVTCLTFKCIHNWVTSLHQIAPALARPHLCHCLLKVSSSCSPSPSQFSSPIVLFL